MAELNGTYGGSKTPCTIYTIETQTGETWYAVEGSFNVNCTFEELSDGVDVELLADHDTATASAPIYSEEDLQGALDE